MATLAGVEVGIETLSCIAVEFRTHWFNMQSRLAIERLGAQLDGILRSHQMSPDGTLRDTPRLLRPTIEKAGLL